MGELADKAKAMSKWLMLDMGESAMVKYIDWRSTPSNFDPDKETIRYEFEADGHKKWWTNGSSYVMLAFDEIPKGSMVKITRNPMTDDNDNIIEGKSRYEIELVE